MAVTTTASFVIQPVNATQTVNVTDTTPFPQDVVFTISDGVNAVVFQVESVGSGTAFTITTLTVLSGATGNTMDADANCTFASVPLSGLPAVGTPAGTDLMYVVQDGTSYQAEVATEIAGPVTTIVDAALASSANPGLMTFATSFPGSPVTGQQVFRTDLSVVFTYNGSAWEVTGTCGIGTSFPTSPAPIGGQFFFRSDTSTLYIRSSGSWVACGGGGGSSSPAAAYQAIVAARSGLIHWWKLNETSGSTINDSVGSANGAYGGTAILNTTLFGGLQPVIPWGPARAALEISARLRGRLLRGRWSS